MIGFKTMRANCQLALLAGLALLVQGCSTIPSAKPTTGKATENLMQQHLKSIATLQNFSIQGRIGVQTQGKGFSGGLNWQHTPLYDDIALSSPLGGQVASIKKSPEKITLEDANGNSVSADSAENLTQMSLGWQLPLSGLSDWSIGRPSVSPIESSTWDEQGHLTTLNQDGWKIEYQNYAEHDGYMLPQKIYLKSEKVNLKLLIEKWLPNEAANR